MLPPETPRKPETTLLELHRRYSENPGDKRNRERFHSKLIQTVERYCNSINRLKGVSRGIKPLLNADELDDVVTDAVERIYDGINTVKEGMNFGTWAFAVSRNAFADMVRSKKRKGEPVFWHELEDEEGNTPNYINFHPLTQTSDSVVDEIHRKRVYSDLAKCLNHLPEAYRKTITLHHLEGRPLEEIADMQGVELGTVKSRLSRGRALLKERMNTYGHDEESLRLAGFPISRTKRYFNQGKKGESD